MYLYIYIYIYTYIYIYIYMYTHMCMYVCTHIHMHIGRRADLPRRHGEEHREVEPRGVGVLVI